MKKLLLLLLIPGLVLAKENYETKPVPAKPKTWSQVWKSRIDSCTTQKEKDYLATHKTVPLEYTLDPAKERLAAAIYEEHRKIYLRIKPCLEKYEK